MVAPHLSAFFCEQSDLGHPAVLSLGNVLVRDRFGLPPKIWLVARSAAVARGVQLLAWRLR
jgi:hypothetical protein